MKGYSIVVRQTKGSHQKGDKKMKSQKFKILYTDKKSKTDYRFDTQKFSDELIHAQQKNSSSSKKLYLKDYYNTIAEEAHTSVEAVKNWKAGNNGPADIEIVKSIAKVLKIDFMNLLSPEEKEQEESIINEEDFKMIQTIYFGIHDIIQMKIDLPDNGKYLDANGYNLLTWKQEQAIRRLMGDVYKNSLWISAETKNKLIRILVEMIEVVNDNVPIRWEGIGINSKNKNDKDALEIYWEVAASYCAYDTREQALEHHDEIYLFDEILVSENLGDTKIKYPEDDLFEKYETVDEISEYGCGEYQLKPPFVYQYLMTNEINRIFRNEFPGFAK